jgi:hypothetical protein
MVQLRGSVLITLGVGVSACSAGDTPPLETTQSALMGGAQLEVIQNPKLGPIQFPDGTVVEPQEAVCTGDARVGLRQSLILGRTLANSRGVSECLERIMTTGTNHGQHRGPYRDCSRDPFHGEPRATQVAEVQKRLTTAAPVGITCVVGPWIDGQAFMNNPAESLWLGGAAPIAAGRQSLEGDRSFTYRTANMAVTAGTVWHETFHTFGYYHSSAVVRFVEDDPDYCAWDASVNYAMNTCLEQVWDGSLEVCAQTACTGGRRLAVLRDFNAWDDGATQGLHCDCVSDSGGAPDARASQPFRTDLELPADPFAVPANGDQRFGHALAVGDFDDDGFDDVAVGIPGKDIGGVRAGAIAVYQGSALGLYPYMLIDQASSGGSNEAGDEFGFALAAADLDDDGITDLVVGAPGDAGRGRVFVYRGVSEVGLRYASSTLGTSAGERFGASLLPLTIDRSPIDRYLVVGAPEHTVSGHAGAGRVVIFQPDASGGSLALQRLASLDEATFATAEDDTHFGAALATGNVRGSGTGFDMLVGAPGADRVYVFDNGDLPDFLPQPEDFAAWTPAVTLAPEEVVGSDYGSAIATGNFDFGPNDEIVVGTGSPRASGQQSVYVHGGDGTLRDRFTSEEPSFGSALWTIDVDGQNTNWDDVVVGAPGIRAVFTITAQVDSEGALAPLELGAPIAVSSTGSGYGAAFEEGDFDADGRADLLVSAPTLAVNGSVAGAVVQVASQGPRSTNLKRINKLHDLDAALSGVTTGNLLPPFGSFEPFGPKSWFSAIKDGAIYDSDFKTQGRASLSFAPGYIEAQSPVFATNEWGVVGTRLLLDVYLPAAQPTSGWKGAIQVFYSVPSANRYHQHLGQVELSSLAAGGWHTIGFDVATSLRDLFLEVHPDGQFFIAVNTDANAPDRVRIDNLRFGGDLVAQPQPGDATADPPGTGAAFVCEGTCLSAIPLAPDQQSGAFGTLDAVWYVVDSNILGWQASEIPGRVVRVNGVQVQRGQVPLPAPVNGKYYFEFTAGAHPWGSWSYWAPQP